MSDRMPRYNTTNCGVDIVRASYVVSLRLLQVFLFLVFIFKLTRSLLIGHARLVFLYLPKNKFRASTFWQRDTFGLKIEIDQQNKRTEKNPNKIQKNNKSKEKFL